MDSARQTDGLWELDVRDTMLDGLHKIQARAVAVCAGIWVDAVAANVFGVNSSWTRPAKGIHILTSAKRLPVRAAVAGVHPTDKRVMFVIPKGRATVIGTTDTDYTGDLEEPLIERKDVDYLLAGANTWFPGAKLTVADIHSAYSGVRPLFNDNRDAAPSAVSREHHVVEVKEGVYALIGGKLTTWRRIASDVLDRAVPYLSHKHKITLRGKRDEYYERPLPGAFAATDLSISRYSGVLAERAGVNAETARNLLYSYGADAEKLLGSRTRLTPIGGGLPYAMEQVDRAVDFGYALRVEDFMARRTDIIYQDQKMGADVVEAVAERMGEKLGWSAARRKDEVEQYRSLCRKRLAALLDI